MKRKIGYSAFVLLMVIFISCDQNYGHFSLKEVLDDQFYIGTALNERQIRKRDTEGLNILCKHFNAVVAEHCMIGKEIHPEEHLYNFALPDQFVRLGEDNNMYIIGHTLICHNLLPQWFCVDDDGDNVSPEILRARMREHICTIIGRYKGRIKSWNVISEAIMGDGSYRESKLYEILGEEFIQLAFQYAHEADPDSELYYNDYNEWYPEKQKSIIRLIRTLKEKGIRIDGVGMQGHLDIDAPTLEEYENAIIGYANEGVKVMITELDLSILPSAWRETNTGISTNYEYQKRLNPYATTIPDSTSVIWNNRMSDFFNLFMKHADKISCVTMWGIADGDSWKSNLLIKRQTDYPLLFDRLHQPKPAVKMIIDKASKNGKHSN